MNKPKKKRKTRNLFKKKKNRHQGTLHAKINIIKERNGKDLA